MGPQSSFHHQITRYQINEEGKGGDRIKTMRRKTIRGTKKDDDHLKYSLAKGLNVILLLTSCYSGRWPMQSDIPHKKPMNVTGIAAPGSITFSSVFRQSLQMPETTRHLSADGTTDLDFLFWRL